MLSTLTSIKIGICMNYSRVFFCNAECTAIISPTYTMNRVILLFIMNSNTFSVKTNYSSLVMIFYDIKLEYY